MSVLENRPAARTGSDLRRVDGPEKVTGRARYAFEHVPDGVAYGVVVTSTIAKGRIIGIDAAPILERPDVVAIITAANAPELPGRDDAELAVLQTHDVSYYGQIVAIVIAENVEAATAAGEDLTIQYEQVVHDVTLRTDHPRATLRPDGRWLVEIDAADIGTGARTALLGFAAERAVVHPEQVELRIADSDLPTAMIAGGSTGTASWTWAIGKAIDTVQERAAQGVPDAGLTAEVSSGDDIGDQPEVAGFSFGAQFAEVHVDVDTGEVRVPRMTGVFAAGRILNAVTARSQLVGGMTMGLSMALHEGAVIDRASGDIINHDLAQYHIAANADIGTIDVTWIDEHDDTLGPAGAKGIGEVGTVGAAAAIANAVHDATGIRIRDLPITPDRLIAHL